jgi:hypothetical protein
MEEALRVFDLVGSAEQISDFAVPEWRLHTFASMLWSRLGDEPRAVAARTQPTEPDPPRSPGSPRTSSYAGASCSPRGLTGGAAAATSPSVCRRRMLSRLGRTTVPLLIAA